MTKRKKQPTSSPDLFQTATVAPVQPVITIKPPAALPISARPAYSFNADQITILTNLIAEAAQAETIQAGPAGLQRTGVSHLDGDSRARVALVLLMHCEGKNWKDIAAFVGITWGLLDVWTSTKAMKRLLTAAKDKKDALKFAEILEASQKEAISDIEDYVIGRVGKDKDGILNDPLGEPMKKRRPNTKMRELFLKAHDKRFRDANGSGDSAANQAKQITYNIAFFRQDATITTRHHQAPIDIVPEAIEGGKQAERSPFG